MDVPLLEELTFVLPPTPKCTVFPVAVKPKPEMVIFVPTGAFGGETEKRETVDTPTPFQFVPSQNSIVFVVLL
jgi:hypothetical protein